MLAMSLASCEKMILDTFDIIQKMSPQPWTEVVGQSDYTIYGSNIPAQTHHSFYYLRHNALYTVHQFGPGLYLQNYERKKAVFHAYGDDQFIWFKFVSDTSFFRINHKYRADQVGIHDINRSLRYNYHDLPPFEFSPSLSTFEFGAVEGFSYTLYFDLLYSRPAVDSTKTAGDTLRLSGSITHFRAPEKSLQR